MALTDIEIKQWVENYVNTNPGYDWDEWNGYTFARGLHHKYTPQLYSLQDMYTEKFKRLYLRYKELREGFRQGVSDSFIQTTPEDAINDLKAIKDKGWRLADKLRTLNAEIKGREDEVFGPGLLFDREYRGTEYYIDLTNGSDASPHTGLKYGNYTMEAGSGATTLVETGGLDSRVTDGDWTPSYVYNVTRSAGALVTNSVYVGGTWTLTHASISGQVSGDTYYILDAWKTISQYTSVATRSPGDIVYVRANTTETVSGAINFDEDGNVNNYISIIGCDSVTNDPWGDASDVKPILDCDSGANYLNLLYDLRWYIEKLDLTSSANASGLIVDSRSSFFWESCVFRDSVRGYGGHDGAIVYLNNCEVKNNSARNLTLVYGSYIRMSGGLIDGGAAPTDYGIYIDRYCTVELDNVDIAQSNEHGIADIYMSYGGRATLRNCPRGTAGITIDGVHGVVFEEDTDGVSGAHMATYFSGVVTKDTGITRVGGADSSAKMEPNSDGGLIEPLSLSHKYDIGAPFKVWCPSTLTTITVYIRSLGTWGTYPTADELYLEASYLDSGTGGSRTKVQSNDVLSHASDWKAFDVTFTPSQAGYVYLSVFLKKYEDAGDGCYVDVLPIAS